MTVVILGIAGVAVMAGLELSVKSSDLGRKQANGGSYVRSLAEAIQNSVNTTGGYIGCAGAGAYATSANKSAAGIPSTYTIAQTAAKQWTSAGWGTCSSDNGSQQVTLTVTSPGTAAHQAKETLTVVIRRPCSGNVPTSASPGLQPC